MRLKNLKLIYFSLLLIIVIINIGYVNKCSSKEVNLNVPFIDQSMSGCGYNGFNNSYCGHTSSVMIFAYHNQTNPTKNDILAIAKHLNHGTCGNGTPNPNDLVDVAKNYGGFSLSNCYGLHCNSYWDLNDLKNEIDNDRPVIVQTHIDMNTNNVTHWMVLRGYSDSDNNGTIDKVIVNDPGHSSGNGGLNKYYSVNTFLNSWNATQKRCVSIQSAEKNINSPTHKMILLRNKKIMNNQQQNANIKREEAWKMIFRSLNYVLKRNLDDNEKYVITNQTNGNRTINRQELLTMFVRAITNIANLQISTSISNPFSDLPNNSFRNNLLKAYKIGLIDPKWDRIYPINVVPRFRFAEWDVEMIKIFIANDTINKLANKYQSYFGNKKNGAYKSSNGYLMQNFNNNLKIAVFISGYKQYLYYFNGKSWKKINNSLKGYMNY